MKNGIITASLGGFGRSKKYGELSEGKEQKNKVKNKLDRDHFFTKILRQRAHGAREVMGVMIM